MTLKVNGISIEWDAEKNIANIKKHHIDFEDAALIFSDENRIEIYDAAHSDDEDRYITIGIVDDILFVVYTERGEALRIISARNATAVEKEYYYGKNS